MDNYIDAFVFPISKKHLADYQQIAVQVADIWKSYGAISYNEFVGDDMNYEGTASFEKSIAIKEGEVVIFGWVVFPDKATRDLANQKVPHDPQMKTLVTPLMSGDQPIFEAGRMLFGGFNQLIQK